jgi:hypothetical protein
MAGRTPISVTSVSRTALTAIPAPATAADVANGNFCYNDGATVLVLLNTDSSAHTLTVQLASGVDGQTAGPRPLPVAISANQQWTGVFPVQFYGNQLGFNLDSALVKVQPVSLLSS